MILNFLINNETSKKNSSLLRSISKILQKFSTKAKDVQNMSATLTPKAPDKLLEKLKLGDDCAFSELVNTHWDKIYNRANSLLSNHQDAEEVAQDTFLRARKSIGNFRGECSISTWLYHIATNLARNKHWYWWRRKRAESISLETPIGDCEDMRVCDVIAGDDDTPAEETSSNEFMAILPKAISSLPTKYANVISLRVAKDLSYEEIAVELDISVGTVKSRLSRAREFLRLELEKRL